MSDPLTIIHGDALAELRKLPEESVQCCVTSPPYFNLRDYGIPPHEWEATSFLPMAGMGLPEVDVPAMTCCLGLESTLVAFVGHTVAIFREVRRVLKKDGTLWMNFGDSYAQAGDRGEQGETSQRKGRANVSAQEKATSQRPPPGLKAKDLMGVPWRAALALQADGWHLRSDIIWHKPNPMPESVSDRPTKAHEYLFLMTKSERYFYDAEAIKEKGATRPRQNESFSAAVSGLVESRNKRTVWTVPTFAFSEAHYATFPPDLIKPCLLAGSRPGDTILDPFGGSGTTGQVAIELGRKAILIELSEANTKLIHQRCAVTPGLGI